MKKIILFLILFLFSISFAENCFKAIISSQSQTDYGCNIPVTYTIGLPEGTKTPCRAYKQYNQTWQEITGKTSDDFFNNIECVRFEYDSSISYISLNFPTDSNILYFKIVDSAGVSTVDYPPLNLQSPTNISAQVVYYDDAIVEYVANGNIHKYRFYPYKYRNSTYYVNPQYIEYQAPSPDTSGRKYYIDFAPFWTFDPNCDGVIALSYMHNGTEVIRNWDKAQRLPNTITEFLDYESDFWNLTVTGSPETWTGYADQDHVNYYYNLPNYYDARKAVVCATGDDWSGSSSSSNPMQSIVDVFAQDKLYLTIGIITELDPNWTEIKNQIATGYVEPASHGRTTKTASEYEEGDAAAEIEGSKQDIFTNLNNDLPDFLIRGNSKYVLTFMEPSGVSTMQARAQIGQSKYLTDRSTVSNVSTFQIWDDANGLLNRIGYTIRMGSGDGGTSDINTLNAKFNSVYNANGIYHLMFHPTSLDDGDNLATYVTSHLTYISGKKDVWYVPFGQLYLYRYMTAIATSEVFVEQYVAQDNRNRYDSSAFLLGRNRY
ncbi:MAG: hypothetical protein PHY02_09545 [Phycisphaerae bacterium]|nr:hypothetical protein [Phycisphaerae bacterium]